MDDVVLMSDPRVAAIGTLAELDPLIDAATQLAVDDRKADATGAWRLLRRPVLDRLVDAAAALPVDLRLVVVEGYRPLELQRAYFDAYALQLRTASPDLAEDDVRRLASRHISPPELAPHSCGAAVDVLLTSPEGVELDLGTPMNATPEESGGRCYTWHPEVTGEALLLRRTLADALEGAGLVNYPTEWWHWSYGDRYWALMTGSPHALYAAVPAP
jgi:zinc D-Ala-D-Ala dipeptidase